MTRLRLALASASVEFRLQLRSMGFWALMAAWQLLLVYFMRSYGQRPGEALDRFSFSMMPLLAAVFAVYVAQVVFRDRREGTVETMDAFPAARSPRMWGRALSLIPAIALLAIEPLAITAWRAGPGTVTTSIILYWAMFYAANLGLAGAFGFVAGSLMTTPFVAYPLSAGLWAGWMMLFTALPLDKPGLWWLYVFSPFDPSTTRHGTTLLWGAFPTGSVAFPHYLLNVATAVAVTALVILLSRRARDRDHIRFGTTALLIVALVAGGLSLRSFLAAENAIVASHARQVELLRETPGFGSGPSDGAEPYGAPPGFEITSYTGVLELGPGRGMRMKVDLVLKIPPGGLEPGPDGGVKLDFTLNGIFEVGRCQAGDAAGQVLVDCPFDRQGNALSLHLPATVAAAGSGPAAGAAPLPDGAGTSSVMVRMEYFGEVWAWDIDATRDMHLAAGVDPAGTILPAGFAWYPLAGRIQPGMLVSTWSPDGVANEDPFCWSVYYYDLVFPDAAWDLSVVQVWPGSREADPVQELVSNITAAPATYAEPSGPTTTHFAGTARNGCFLIGAPEVSTIQAGDVVLYAAPSSEEGSRAIAGYLTGALDFLKTTGIELGRPFIAATLPLRAGFEPRAWCPQLGGGLGTMEAEAAFQMWALKDGRPGQMALRDQYLTVLLDRAVFPGRLMDLDPRGTRTDEAGAEAFYGAYYVGEAFKGFLRALALGELFGEEEYTEAVRLARPWVRLAGGAAADEAFDSALALLDRFHRAHGSADSAKLCRMLLEDVRALRLGPGPFAARVAALEQSLTGGAAK